MDRTYFLISVYSIDLLLAFDITGEVFANKKIISSAKPLIPFQGSQQRRVIVLPKGTA